MQRAIPLVAILALLSCADEPNGGSDTIRVIYPTGLERPTDESVALVEDVFGMEVVEVSDTPLGAIQIYTLPDFPGNGVKGSAISNGDCSASLWSVLGDSQTLAHELGHTLQLEHVGAVGNLMDISTTEGLDLTDEQVDIARETAWLFDRCRKNPP